MPHKRYLRDISKQKCNNDDGNKSKGTNNNRSIKEPQFTQPYTKVRYRFVEIGRVDVFIIPWLRSIDGVRLAYISL